MSITDELRKYVQSWRETPNLMDELDAGDIDGILGDFIAIADHIDAKHEAKVSYWQGASYKDGYDEGFASADDWLADHEDAMAEHGWIRLPKDADGEYIRAGDVMDSRVDYLFDGKPFTVRELVLCEDGWEVADGRFGNRYEPDSLRHHHAPTVEDVLTEFGIDWEHESDCEDRAALLKEYATKLQLKEDE